MAMFPAPRTNCNVPSAMAISRIVGRLPAARYERLVVAAVFNGICGRRLRAGTASIGQPGRASGFESHRFAHYEATERGGIMLPRQDADQPVSFESQHVPRDAPACNSTRASLCWQARQISARTERLLDCEGDEG